MAMVWVKMSKKNNSIHVVNKIENFSTKEHTKETYLGHNPSLVYSMQIFGYLLLFPRSYKKIPILVNIFCKN